MKDLSILENKNMELKAKYLYLYLIALFDSKPKSKQISISAESLGQGMGISLPMLYRARSVLVKLGAIKHLKKYSEDTGKKIGDIYELT